MTDSIRDNRALQRFELDADGQTSVAYYKLADGVITFMHTEIPVPLQGRGIASRLIRGALDSARERGLKVVAKCQFVGSYIAKHPSYGDLLL
jgi:predicted GNAT family acetyltransferase